MNRWFGLALIFLFIIPLVVGLDLCETPVQVNEACVILSPPINCSSPEFWVYNLSGALKDSGNMTLVNASIYKFTFNQSLGDYVVKFCDNSSQEVIVAQGGDDANMIIGTIILLPLILSIVILLGAFVIDKDRHAVLRVGLWFLSLILFLVSLNFGLVSLVEFYDFPVLEDLIGSTVYWFSLVLVAVVFYWIFYLVYTSFMMFKKRRSDRELAEWHDPQQRQL